MIRANNAVEPDAPIRCAPWGAAQADVRHLLQV